MSQLPETPEDKEERKRNILARQREMLQHLPAWFRHAGVTARQVAEQLGVLEASVSKWISGTDAMRIGYLRQIATVLKAEPEDLLAAPPTQGLAPAVAALLDAAEGLSPEQLAHLAETARLLARKP
nr:helix-turn-helix transcriptional regulator [uncultured Roseococcus sp.]